MSNVKDDRKWTKHLIFTTSVACIASLQYGYHMSELNGPGAVISCQASVPLPGKAFEDSFYSRTGRIECFSMDDQQLGLVTSIFSIGGLLSSTYAGVLAQFIGRKKTSILNGIIFAIGSIIMTLANNVLALAVGRFVAGLAAGCSIVVTPLLISEISPHGLKGFLGSMNQVAINLGILLTQVLAVKWANNVEWRNLLLFGALLGALNVVAVFFSDESPKWLESKGRIQESKRVLSKLRGSDDYLIDEEQVRSYGEERSLSSTSISSRNSRVQPNVSIFTYITNSTYSKSLLVVTAVLAGQQFCGINSIIFYGVNTIRKLIPNYAVLINCLISLGNAVITFVAAPFVDKYGRVPCLVASVSLMGAASALMSLGILRSIPSVSVLSTFIYVGSFAIGLGPIPFLLISEVTQFEAIGSAQSYGTVVNWISTFLIGYLFPIVDSLIGGYVYSIFAAISAVFVLFIINRVPETKGRKTYEEVWNLRVD